ncbi:hypothetical protein SDC9_124255 [bioreactor metagenome]|uniref:Uncharacterized protein n=1 Tax=bioreactor metagenome TaxID=1076179 RepID=A0A645CJZ0_9ZZZZ
MQQNTMYRVHLVVVKEKTLKMELEMHHQVVYAIPLLKMVGVYHF